MPKKAIMDSVDADYCGRDALTAAEDFMSGRSQEGLTYHFFPPHTSGLVYPGAKELCELNKSKLTVRDRAIVLVAAPWHDTGFNSDDPLAYVDNEYRGAVNAVKWMSEESEHLFKEEDEAHVAYCIWGTNPRLVTTDLLTLPARIVRDADYAYMASRDRAVFLETEKDLREEARTFEQSTLHKAACGPDENWVKGSYRFMNYFHRWWSPGAQKEWQSLKDENMKAYREEHSMFL